MTTIRAWMKERKIDGSSVEGFVFYSPEYLYLAGWPECDSPLYGRRLGIDEAAPLLDIEFDDGFGSQGCPNFNFWTAERVYYVHEYDGSTSLSSEPRNPPAAGRESTQNQHKK